MAKTIAINGFGRIGRLVFRNAMEMGDMQVAAVNDIAPLDNLVYLLRHDSVQRTPDVDIRADGDTLHWGDRAVKFTSEKDPGQLPWKELGVDIAIEGTGLFTKADDARKHLEAGAEYTLITAPGKGDIDLTVCMGVNEEMLDLQTHRIISNASCTTNCLAPVAKVLHEAFGIETGFLTTIHAYTSSQAIVDAPAKKWRRGRAGAMNIVPTSTGAAVATTEVLPQLKGRLDGMAMRVPIPVGSICDFVVRTEKPVGSVDAVNEEFRTAANSAGMKGILGASDEELVSSDIIGSNYSSLVDLGSTMVLGDRTVKALSWYDNEWGYARRVVDLARYIAERI